MPQPRVSVIMNCLNGAKYLRASIESVYAQTCKDWEIVFWDNASTDGSGEIARGYDRRLRYFRSTETIPLGRARNMSLQEARGELIAFLDCDDLWMPEKLEKQVPLFDRNPRTGLVFSDTFFFNDNGETRRLYANSRPPRGMVFKRLLTDYFLSLETVVIRKSALDGLSEWFDERLEVNEEADLFIRIAYWWEADCVHEPLAKWRVHAGSLTWQKKERFAIESQLMLDKYIGLFPGLREEAAGEVESMRRRISKQRFMNAWEKGDGSGRSMLKPYLGKDPKALALYMASFLPYRAAAPLIGYYRERRGLVSP
ncbi:MAG: glycosyltransferase [Candidatus Methylomirabilis sp.]|nr:glycosyltransferase [Deltaproteobacteria bacterium]